MINYRKIVPIRLKYFRSKFDFTQEDLAKEINIAQSTYANWECGKRLPDLDKIANIADFYSTSIDLLLGRTDIY